MQTREAVNLEYGTVFGAAGRSQISSLFETLILNCFEPDPVHFVPANKRGGLHTKSAIERSMPDKLVILNPSVNRNDFLWGCQEYTHEKEAESLIVGYGRRFSSTTKIAKLHHAVGKVDHVGITTAIYNMMLNHFAADEANEIVIFHNHPRSWMNHLFDNEPLPSITDRATLVKVAFTPLPLIRTLFGRGRFLFYLGENGFVRQFRVPPLQEITNALAVIGQQLR